MCFEAATTAKEVATIPGDDEHHNLCHDGYMMVMVMMMLMRNIFIFVIMTRMMVVMKMVMMSMFNVHLCHGGDDGDVEVGDDDYDYDDRGDVGCGAPTFHDSQHCNGDQLSPQPLLLGPGQKKHMKNHRMKEKMKINQKSWNEGEGENQTTILQNTPQCSNPDSVGCKPSSSCSPFQANFKQKLTTFFYCVFMLHML